MRRNTLVVVLSLFFPAGERQSDWHTPDESRKSVNKPRSRGLPQLTRGETIALTILLAFLVIFYRQIGIFGAIVISAAIWIVFFQPRIARRK